MKRETEEKLLNCKTLSEFVTMYMGLGLDEKLSIFTEDINVSESTEFYRVRKAGRLNDANYKNPKEWAPVPTEYAKQGRFNADKESILYVTTDPYILERELNIKKGEVYYMAKYVCKKSFKVGSLLSRNSFVNSIIHKIAMSISGSDCLSESENELVEEYFKSKNEILISELWKDILAPFYIHKLLPKLYDKTNKIGKLIISKYDCGFRYASVYESMLEHSGLEKIITFDGKDRGNYALTEKGYSNIKYIDAEKYICNDPITLDLALSTFCETNIDD